MPKPTPQAKESRWKDLVNHLKQSGFDVFPPGVKTGHCTKPYIVVKFDGSTRMPNISTDEDFYSVLCYVPKQAYSEIDPLVQKVKTAMRTIQPLFLPYGNQTPSFFDDAIDAHMVSIEYKNYKKLM